MNKIDMVILALNALSATLAVVQAASPEQVGVNPYAYFWIGAGNAGLIVFRAGLESYRKQHGPPDDLPPHG